jgi:hypothetical protein
MKWNAEMECEMFNSYIGLSPKKILQKVILPNEIIIMIYTFADIATKFKMINVFKWLLNVKINCSSNKCKKNAKYILKYKLLPMKCFCNFDKSTLHFVNCICSLKCNTSLLENYRKLSLYIGFDDLNKHNNPHVNTNEYNGFGKIGSNYTMCINYYLYGRQKCIICNCNFYYQKVKAYGYIMN